MVLVMAVNCVRVEMEEWKEKTNRHVNTICISLAYFASQNHFFLLSYLLSFRSVFFLFFFFRLLDSILYYFAVQRNADVGFFV